MRGTRIPRQLRRKAPDAELNFVYQNVRALIRAAAGTAERENEIKAEKERGRKNNGGQLEACRGFARVVNHDAVRSLG